MAEAYAVIECPTCGGKFARSVNETWKKTCRSCHQARRFMMVVAEVQKEFPEDAPIEVVIEQAKEILVKRQEANQALRRMRTMAGAFEKAGIKVEQK
ncbi:MAG: hypothetical protein Q8K86_09645 [Candidatus Nanopelagicaceae bacterium]|nr:hypothetical protein [Candidatus Nanopelagicaceae bacterium]